MATSLKRSHEGVGVDRDGGGDTVGGGQVLASLAGERHPGGEREGDRAGRGVLAVPEHHTARRRGDLHALTVAELGELEDAVVAIMDLQEDSVVQIDLGPTSACVPIRSIGRPRQLSSSGSQIV